MCEYKFRVVCVEWGVCRENTKILRQLHSIVSFMLLAGGRGGDMYILQTQGEYV